MSNTFGLTVSRDDIINAALRTLGKLGKSQVASTTDKANCSQALNLMIKSWVNKGTVLWKIKELVIPLVPGITKYPLGPSGGYLVSAGVTITTSGSGGTDGTYALTITETALNSAGAGATGTYTILGGVLSSISITAAGSSYVSPVLSFPLGSLSGATATINPVGLAVPRPARILDDGSFVRNNVSVNDIPVLLISREEYNMLGNKSQASGQMNQMWYDASLGNGILNVYPPLTVGLSMTLYAIAQIIFDDTVNPSDTFDFPQEFMNALKWGLCRELYTEYGVSADTERRVERMYAQYVTEAFDFSQEEADITFVYDNRGMG